MEWSAPQSSTTGGTFLLLGKRTRRMKANSIQNWRTEAWSYKCLQERITPAPRNPGPGVFSHIHFASAGTLADVSQAQVFPNGHAMPCLRRRYISVRQPRKRVLCLISNPPANDRLSAVGAAEVRLARNSAPRSSGRYRLFNGRLTTKSKGC